MNERIQQMIYNLNEKVGVHWTNEDKLKFAELIVRECAEIGYDQSYYECALNVSNKIKQNFGVK